MRPYKIVSGGYAVRDQRWVQAFWKYLGYAFLVLAFLTGVYLFFEYGVNPKQDAYLGGGVTRW